MTDENPLRKKDQIKKHFKDKKIKSAKIRLNAKSKVIMARDTARDAADLAVVAVTAVIEAGNDTSNPDDDITDAARDVAIAAIDAAVIAINAVAVAAHAAIKKELYND